ncbi:MAG: hypothetical protein AAF401_04780 [Pseudomonadota bacterium]
MTDRRQDAYAFRVKAAEAARSRAHPKHEANGDEQRWAHENYAMSFTKGLEHEMKSGLIKDKAHFEAFRRCIDDGYIDPFTAAVPVPRDPKKDRRQWEAPTAGVAFELEGPDPQAVTMPPAPELGSDELTFEMAEVYELALLRDVRFIDFMDAGTHPGQTPGNNAVDASHKRLSKLKYAKAGFPGRPRKVDPGTGKLDDQTVFRGSAPGVEKGPYISSFLLLGNDTPRIKAKATDGLIEYGGITIDQKIAIATPEQDYMQKKKDWLHIQDGFEAKPVKDEFTGHRRFISTPRDLATYVHFDALYEAYLNAALILWNQKAPTDPAFDQLSGGGKLHQMTAADSIDRNAGGFALYGGPHVLTLVTEVATRALKAVRY